MRSTDKSIGIISRYRSSRLVTGPTTIAVKRAAKELKAQGYVKRDATRYSPQAKEFYQWWDMPRESRLSEPPSQSRNPQQ